MLVSKTLHRPIAMDSKVSVHVPMALASNRHELYVLKRMVSKNDHARARTWNLLLRRQAP